MPSAIAPYLCADVSYTGICYITANIARCYCKAIKYPSLFWSILNAEKSVETKVAVTGCTLLILASIGIFVQQTPEVTGDAKIYDSDYVDVLRTIGDNLPEGGVVIASANGPQTGYFTGHEIKIPRGVDSLKSLVEFMEK
jgi:hypothetical protein